MLNTDPTPIPHGLPKCLSNEKSGFTDLCKTLEIGSTQRKKELVNLKGINTFLHENGLFWRGTNPKRPPQAERLKIQITGVYSDPLMRKRLWIVNTEQDHNDSNQKTRVAPSLELASLKNINENVLSLEPDHETLKNCSQFFSSKIIDSNEHKPAIVVLPIVKNDFENWETLTEERRHSIVCAGFAISTILEDARLIQWASTLHNDIQNEYSFISAKPEAKSTTLDNPKQTYSLEVRIKDQAKELMSTTHLVVEEGATRASIETLLEQSKSIQEVAGDWLSYIKQSTVDGISGILDELYLVLDNNCNSHSWLKEQRNRIVKAWMDEYPLDEDTDLILLEEDVNRVKTQIDKWIDDVTAFENKIVDRKEELANYQTALEKPYSRVQSFNINTLKGEIEQQITSKQQNIELLISKLLPITTDELTNLTPQLVMSERDIGRNTKGTDAIPLNVNSKEEMSNEDAIHKVKDQNEQTEGSTEGNNSSTSENDDPPLKPILNPVAENQNFKTTQEKYQQNDNQLDDPTLSDSQKAMWTALIEGKYGLAYHITKLDSEASVDPGQPTSDLLGSLALSQHVLYPDDEVSLTYSKFTRSFLSNIESEKIQLPLSEAQNLLLLSATLLPSIFAASEGSNVKLLKYVNLSNSLGTVQKFIENVIDVILLLQRLDFSISSLESLWKPHNWSERFAEFKESVNRWYDAATNSEMLNLPNQYWHHWLKTGEKLHLLRDLLLSDDRNNLSKVKEFHGCLEDNGARRDFIYQSDYQAGRSSQRKLSGKEFNQLSRNLEMPFALTDEWLDIISAKPEEPDYTTSVAQQLADTISNSIEDVLESLFNLSCVSDSLPLLTALAITEKSIRFIQSIFRSDSYTVRLHNTDSSTLLTSDLLFVTDVRLQDLSGPGVIKDSELLLDRLTSVEDHSSDLLEAFDTRLSNSDLFGANLIAEFVETQHDIVIDEDRIDRLDFAVDYETKCLRTWADELHKKSEQMYAIRNISMDEFENFMFEISEIRNKLGNLDFLLTARDRISQVASEIESRFLKALVKIEEQFNKENVDFSTNEVYLINEAKDKEDLILIHEQIESIRNGQKIPINKNVSSASSLRDFKKSLATVTLKIEAEGHMNVSSLLSACSGREDYRGLGFSSLNRDRSKRSKILLEAWFKLAETRSIDINLVSIIFSGLGFTLLESPFSMKENTLALKTEPIRTRDLCPTYSYGSAAGGKYSVILVWGMIRESVAQTVSAGDPNSHTIVLYFDRLAEQERTWLRDWSREQATQLIVIDESLILYLSSRNDGGLRKLFDCSLPYSNDQPYYNAPGLVPPESFYGRKIERASILDRHGSCFVYGGRQLGKTALLQDCKGKFHDPSSGHIAAYVDLKLEEVGVGYEQSSHLYIVLWDLFMSNEVIPFDSAKPQSERGFANAIEQSLIEWLNSNSDGRILLLLDEADAFLEADSVVDFPVSTRLKGIMDKTDRKFKVVFCGLHNVLRSTERANHPLAHLGQPICIGPLFNNKDDLNAARALVQEPMSSAGYEFEDETLVTQILCWTNYYPSLIQILGDRLLQDLRRDSQKAELPAVIVEDDIRSVLSRENFKDYIRDRFLLTLQLDPRYVVIAYGIAYALNVEPIKEYGELSNALTSSTILNEVRDWWPEGFDITKREFETLLHELCGLGVLRQRNDLDGKQRFLFRSPSVLLLLGNSDEIRDTLTEDRVVCNEFDASSYHARYKNTATNLDEYGPLTFEQEGILKKGRRVAIFCGSIDEIPEFLESRLNKPNAVPYLRTLKQSNGCDGLQTQIKALRPTGYDPYLYSVHPDDNWDFNWVEITDATLRQIVRGPFIRVAFSADSDRLWKFIDESPLDSISDTNVLFDWIPVKPWGEKFLRRLSVLKELHDPPNRLKDLIAKTGGWSLLIKLYMKSDRTTWETRLKEIDDFILTQTNVIKSYLGLSSQMTRDVFEPIRKVYLDERTLNFEDIDTYVDYLNDDNYTHLTIDDFAKRLHWSIILGYLSHNSTGIELNPLIRRILIDEQL